MFLKNKAAFYSFDSKYKNKTETIISNIDTKIKKEIQKYSRTIFKVLKCKNMARIDFFYDKNKKKLYFNEINTIPGFTDISMYPKLINNLGINAKKLLTILLTT